MKRRQYTDRHKAHPVWHWEECLQCHAKFEELSDPDASMHLCSKHLHDAWGWKGEQQPLQKREDADDWWNNFVEQYEFDKAYGVPEWRREK